MNNTALQKILDYRLNFNDGMCVDVDEKYYREIQEAKKDGKFGLILEKMSGPTKRSIGEIISITNLQEKRLEEQERSKKQAERFGIYDKKHEPTPFIALCKRVLKWQLKCGGLLDSAIFLAKPEMKKEIKEYLETSIKDLSNLPFDKKHTSGTLPDIGIINHYKEFLKLINGRELEEF